MSIDTRYLDVFHAVCETGSATRAAERLHVTQPAISYHTRMLEEQVGVPLFERAGRRLVLTAEGRRLRDFCRRYFTEIESLTGELSRQQPSRSAPLRVASVSAFGRHVLFPALCSEPFAHLRLELRYGTAEEVFELVGSGSCELGTTFMAKVSSQLELLPVYVEELVLIVPRAGRATRGLDNPEGIEALALVTYDECDYVFGAWFDAVYGQQPSRITSVHHFEEIEEVVAMVALGRGCSVVPLDAVNALGYAARVRVVRPRRRACRNLVYLVHRAGSFAREEVKALVDQLRRSSPVPVEKKTGARPETS